MVRTWSRPYGLCYHPYTKAHIKGFGSFLFACLCLLASMLNTCASLSCSRLCHVWRLRGLDLVWLHLMPIRPCSDVTIWEASSDARFLRAYPSLFRSAWCYVYHACLYHPLAFYASLHACSHVHAWVLLASVSSMLQHNEVMDIRSKPTFVPCGHHLLLALLFAFLLVCLLTCLLAFFFLCLPCLSCLSAGFLPLPLHVYTWSDDTWS